MNQVLPHEGHMLLLDDLLEYGPEHVICAVTIRPETLFCDGKGVPAWVGIEYMAQAACAYAGISDAEAGKPPRICLLLGARRYRAETPLFVIGSQLRVVASLTLRDESDLAAFDCEIFSRTPQGERLVARGDIKAFRPKDVGAVLRGERI